MFGFLCFIFGVVDVPIGSNFLRRITSGVWGAVDYLKKSFREWRRPPPSCPSPPPVASSVETHPTPETTLVSVDTLTRMPYFDLKL